jgi:hypothetical protein
MKIGLWVDDHPRVVTRGDYLDRVVDLGITSLAIMVDDFSLELADTWALDDLRLIRQRAVVERDIEVGLTVCPYPTHDRIMTLFAMLGYMVDESGASFVEYDLESNWRSRHGDLAAMGDLLVEMSRRDLHEKRDTRFEATTFPGHSEHTDLSTVARYCDRFFSQAYSVSIINGARQSWESQTRGPGRAQESAYKKARLAFECERKQDGRPAIGLGLPAWAQTWPMRSIDKAMGLAYDKAIDLVDPVVGLRYWSSKWVLGGRMNYWAAKFLKSLQTASVRRKQ